MAQIVPGVPNLGELLGTGLGQGIQQLAQSQLDRMLKQRQQQSAFQALQGLGYNPQQAAQLSQFEPDILKSIATQKAKASARSSTAAPGLRAIIPGLSEQESSQIGELTPGLQLEYYRNYLKSLGVPEAQQDAIIEQAVSAPAQQTQQQIAPEQQLSQMLGQKPIAQEAKPAAIAEEIKAPKVPEKKPLTKTEQIEQNRIKKQQAIEKKAAEKEALAATKETRKKIFDLKKSAQDTIENIDRMEELEKEGLPSTGYLEFLKNAGLDIPALVGANAEEYNKIAANFIRNAKGVFGSRITDNDLNQFLKTLPSLANSPEGRKRINANLKRIANLDNAAIESYEEILKENKGIPPLDLDLRLDKALDKKRSAIYKKFKEDLSKEVPEGESPYVTALLSGAGKLVGRLPRAAAGAGLGALAGGRYGGPAGIIPGAIVGGLGGLSGISVKDLI